MYIFSSIRIQEPVPTLAEPSNKTAKLNEMKSEMVFDRNIALLTMRPICLTLPIPKSA